MKKKSGISLIAMTITVIVMTTLASVAILAMKKDNHIEYANKTALLADLKSAKIELLSTLSNRQIKDKTFDPDSITVTGKEVLTYIENLKEEYVGKVWIENGKLYLVKGAFSTFDVKDLEEVGIYEK